MNSGSFKNICRRHEVGLRLNKDGSPVFARFAAAWPKMRRDSRLKFCIESRQAPSSISNRPLDLCCHRDGGVSLVDFVAPFVLAGAVITAVVFEGWSVWQLLALFHLLAIAGATYALGPAFRSQRFSST